LGQPVTAGEPRAGRVSRVELQFAGKPRDELRVYETRDELWTYEPRDEVRVCEPRDEPRV